MQKKKKKKKRKFSNISTRSAMNLPSKNVASFAYVL